MILSLIEMSPLDFKSSSCTIVSHLTTQQNNAESKHNTFVTSRGNPDQAVVICPLLYHCKDWIIRIIGIISTILD